MTFLHCTVIWLEETLPSLPSRSKFAGNGSKTCENEGSTSEFRRNTNATSFQRRGKCMLLTIIKTTISSSLMLMLVFIFVHAAATLICALADATMFLVAEEPNNKKTVNTSRNTRERTQYAPSCVCALSRSRVTDIFSKKSSSSALNCNNTQRNTMSKNSSRQRGCESAHLSADFPEFQQHLHGSCVVFRIANVLDLVLTLQTRPTMNKRKKADTCLQHSQSGAQLLVLLLAEFSQCCTRVLADGCLDRL